jgi:hypothetical protein
MSIKITKGTLLLVKSPPYYKDEYFYEVTSAGDKVIKANLWRSPKVKKSWNAAEFQLLIKMGVVRLAEEGEVPD